MLISETDAKELSSLPRVAEPIPRFASSSFKTPSKRSSSSDFFVFLLRARPIPLTDPPPEPLLSSKPPQSSSSFF